MDSVQQSSNRGCIEDTSDSRVHYDGYSVFGDPEIFPRIGDEFQAEIPALGSGYDLSGALKGPAGKGSADGSLRFSGAGLPIPIMWIGAKVESMKSERPEDPSFEKVPVKSGEFQWTLVDNDKETEVEPGFGSSNLSMRGGKEVSKQRNTGFHVPLPGLECSSSSNEKEETFLLGLYIFGKNLRQVKNFMEPETMGTVLFHYYGKFYGSPKYRRWSELRKMKSRKCILGQKILTGTRQPELFSRLLPDLSIESRNRLLEVAKTFGEGRTSFEDMCSVLRPNHTVSLCPEIPVGKACSELSAGEIIGFLTGGFRLSKARSNDLFWEAVWPRLLARGWHSEQPENGYRHALVFLVPGVKKFSRRRLVKGNHYFDSVSDVLSKVATEPRLLDIEELEANREEHGSLHGSEPDEESVDEDHPCYLKPRTGPSRSPNEMKFTIVDTSRANGDIRKLRELHCFPSEMSTSPAPLRERGNVCCDEPTNASVSADSLIFSMDETKTGKKISHQGKDFEHGASSWGSATTGLDSADVFAEVQNGPKDFFPRKIVKSRPKPRVRPKMKSIVDRAQKSHAHNQFDTSCNFVGVPVQSIHKQEEASCCSSNPHVGEILLMADPSAEPFLAAEYGTNGDLCISVEGGAAFSSEISSKVSSQEHPQARTLIDLNLPVLPDMDFDDGTEVVYSQQDNNACQESDLQSGKYGFSEQEFCPSPRRQGTRNQQPTARALEAFALGLLDTKKKRKARTGSSTECLLRPSKRPAGRLHGDENHTNSVFRIKLTFNANLFTKMDAYAIVSLCGEPPLGLQMSKTNVDREGSTNPSWNFPVKFRINEAAAKQNCLTITFLICGDRALGDQDVRTVVVPVKELYDGGAAMTQMKPVTYHVRKLSGKPKGALHFSYKFGETEKTPYVNPAADVAAVPVAYPVGTSMVYPPPAPHPAYAYPAQSYPVNAYGGYPPQPGYGYPQKPSNRNMGLGLGAGLLGGVLSD
ncbi:hypothetical protein MLD38_023565 [Melastoma candidum]|uniref:Uncharacterized protein n=1 Tax=Melastoma candidum TaxID=119954 RepID=A0ACB9NRC2_9MYRT|nr:hypothetical protein MLD38_023565 [Melastoma candidum]